VRVSSKWARAQAWSNAALVCLALVLVGGELRLPQAEQRPAVARSAVTGRPGVASCSLGSPTPRAPTPRARPATPTRLVPSTAAANDTNSRESLAAELHFG
jgi:hypothetical protein